MTRNNSYQQPLFLPSIRGSHPSSAAALFLPLLLLFALCPLANAQAGSDDALAKTPPLEITTTSLPQAQQGALFRKTLKASGGKEPYTWEILTGYAPFGIALNPQGDLAGTPSTPGNFNLTIQVEDHHGTKVSAPFTVTVLASPNFDGPAELPLATVQTAMADTPAPGAVITVNAGDDLQAALNTAQCGDTIELQAGATFTGQFNVPALGCNIDNWIIVRTSSPDSALPPEGARATPCYANRAALPGRPQYSCAQPAKIMATVQMDAQGNGPFYLDAGASFYRFVGLEITRPVGAPGVAVLFSARGATDHIIVDRSWLHGAPQDETYNGVNLSGMTNAAVIDSYFSDFHCVAITGFCTDAHAIGGGVSSTQDGPFLIQDNFLEASGQGILFGGGPATMTPSDITITGNHFWKPWQWMPGNPKFIGGPDGSPFIVKNHLELKNASRVLVEGNLMENSWGGFTQTGYSILLTPKNQHTPGGPNVCPHCAVTDITIRYNQASHAGGGMQLATVISGNGRDGGPAYAGERWSIHDIVLDDISAANYNGDGTAFEIENAWKRNPLNSLTINHVTAFPDSSAHMLSVGNVQREAPMFGLVFTNNLLIATSYPVWNTGGRSSCAVKDVPETSLHRCFTTFDFSDNAIIATPTAFPPALWPVNNLFPQTVTDVQFTNFNNGNRGNYELLPTSPYKNAGTDGADLGADIVGLATALANVE